MFYHIRHNTLETTRHLNNIFPDSTTYEWDLLELSGEPITLGSYETEEQAQFALLYWQTIDLVQERYEMFRDDLATELGILNSVMDDYIEEAVN